MIRQVSLKNFKPFGETQSAPLSVINLIYGPNSSGKSSIIQALMLLRQSAESFGLWSPSLVPRGDYVDLGSFKSLLHKHEIKRSLEISIEFQVPRYVGSNRRAAASHQRLDEDLTRRVTVTFNATNAPGSRKKDSSELASAKYELMKGEETELCVELEKGGRSESAQSRLNVYKWANSSSIESLARFVLKQESIRKEDLLRRRTGGEENQQSNFVEWTQEELIRFLEDSFVEAHRLLPGRLRLERDSVSLNETPRAFFNTNRALSGPIEAIVNEWHNLIDSTSYLGPLRSYPARHYLVTGGARDGVGTRGEFTPQMIYKRNKVVSDEINKWFVKFDIPYKLSMKQVGDEVTGEIITMNLLDTRTGVQVTPADVGFGIGQLLPIIVEGIASEHAVLCVEQPEIHLHPRLQAHIADLLIETSGLPSVNERQRPRQMRPRKQWIVETHSEVLILRLQKRIREGRISPDDVRVLYVHPGEETGSRIRNLRLNDEGNFVDEWPDGFFEESYQEMLG